MLPASSGPVEIIICKLRANCRVCLIRNVRYDSFFLTLQIIFEGIAGTGFYGSDVAIDDISVNLSSSCEFNPKDARPVPATTPSTSKSLKIHKLKIFKS